MIIIHKNYDELFSVENILIAWQRFRRGKSNKKDVINFEAHLEDNLFSLSGDLRSHIYRHSAYGYFQIFDNKERDIYKAQVRDRIIHQIIYDHLSEIFELEFIADS